MNNSEFIVSKCIEFGAVRCFSMVGGHSLFLNKAFSDRQELKVTYIHNEQSASMAADSYFRINKKMAIVNVTAGPAALNCINGVYGAYVDSIPMIVISGGPKLSQTVNSTGMDLRQYGDQEFDRIIDVVKPVCKKVIRLSHVSDIEYELDSIYRIATCGRPGPVWIDVPMDVQSAEFKKKKEREKNLDNNISISVRQNEPTKKQLNIIIEKIKESKRPLLYLGDQIRIYDAEKPIIKLAKILKIPVVTEWNAHDLIDSNSDFFVGRPGLRGERSGNLVVYASDLILAIGSKLATRQVGSKIDEFAPNALKIMVDNDISELYKPHLNIDIPINANPKLFLDMLLSMLSDYITNKSHSEWLSRAKYNYIRNKPKVEDYKKTEKLNPYHFLFEFSENTRENDIIVLGNGISVVGTFQTIETKKGQIIYQNVGCASMGYDLPAAIGAAIDSDRKVICLTGDGSIQLNIQELQTIKHNDLNVSIIAINNNGYDSIRQSQINIFGKGVKRHGISYDTGVSFPKLEKIAQAYGFEYSVITIDNMNSFEWNKFLGKKLNILEVYVTDNQDFEPKVGFTLDDQGRIHGGTLINMNPQIDKNDLQNYLDFLIS